MPASSAFAGRVPVQREPTYAELEQRAAKLTKQYRGELAELEDVKRAVKTASTKVRAIEAQLDQVRRTVAQLAASRYMSGGIDPSLAIFASDDPQKVLDQVATAEQIARANSAKVAQLERLSGKSDDARTDAREEIEKLKKTIKELEGKRAAIQKRLSRFRPESPVVGGSGLTPRMITLRNEIDRRYGPFPTIGCLRPGDSGEHGSGRACDFMESTGGSMPTAGRQAHGDAVAQWAINNASRYGVMYIIWRQRIWDTRTGGGWATMEDRGSITANHYDHVHISVL